MAIRTQSIHKGKKKNRDYQIILDRLFSPDSRYYDLCELDFLPRVERGKTDSIVDKDSVQSLLPHLSISERTHQLAEVKVEADRVQTVGGRINIEYDVAKEVDDLIDSRVSYTENMLDFLERINPYFYRRDVRTFTRDIGGIVDPVQTYTDAPKINTSPELSGTVADGAFYSNGENSSESGALGAESGVGLGSNLRTIDTGRKVMAQANFTGEEYKETCFYKGRRVYFYINGARIENTVWLDVSNVLVQEVKSIQIVEEFDFVRVNFICDRSSRRLDKKGFRLTSLQGYSVPQDFYTTDYSKGYLPDERDYRRTLYWNPDLATDSLGRAQVTFYNNSTATRLRVDVEAMSTGGISGTVD